MNDRSNDKNGNVIVAYQASRSSADILMWIGIGLAAVTVLLFLVSKDMTVPGLAIFFTLCWWLMVIWSFRRELRAVRLLDSGTVEFVKKFGTEAYPVTAITRMDGITKTSSSPEGRASISYYVKFIIDVPGKEPLEKRLWMSQPGDPALDELATRLEQINSTLDTSGYREWVKKS